MGVYTLLQPFRHYCGVGVTELHVCAVCVLQEGGSREWSGGKKNTRKVRDETMIVNAGDFQERDSVTASWVNSGHLNTCAPGTCELDFGNKGLCQYNEGKALKVRSSQIGVGPEGVLISVGRGEDVWGWRHERKEAEAGMMPSHPEWCQELRAAMQSWEGGTGPSPWVTRSNPADSLISDSWPWELGETICCVKPPSLW